jgi:hypothetical protein
MPFELNQPVGPFTKEIGCILNQTVSTTHGVEQIEKLQDQTIELKYTYSQAIASAVTSHAGSGSTTRTPYAAR